MQVNLTQEEFDRRVAENTETFMRQKQDNSFDVSKYHLATHLKGELSIPILIANIHDIYASIIVGALASPDRHGCDAILMDNHIITHVELKTSYLSQNSVWKNEKNKIYTGTSNNKNRMRAIESYLKAEYKLKMDNLEEKIMDTYLICIDGTSSDIICVYKIGKDNILSLLNYNNGIKHHGNTYRKSVQLYHFKKYGSLVKTSIPQVGIDEWKSMMLPNIPTLNKGEHLSAYKQ
jgi:hypothetical protein